MEFEKLTAQVRTGRKKGVARRLRREGFIPAVCYGVDMQPVALSVNPKSLSEIMNGELGRNAPVNMSVDGAEPVLVMLQDYQYHPVTREVLHADFLRVTEEQHVHVRVPLRLTGRSVGVQAGGVLSRVFRDLPVVCRPDQIPGEIVLDVTEMGLGAIRKVADLTLPEGVVVEYDAAQTLVSVSVPSSAADEAETTEEEEEAGGAE
jgi:large subunit ribosomal protein L25